MKKSVLFLTQNLPVPQDRRVFREAKTLKENGFSVSIISPRKKNQLKTEVISGIRVYRYLRFPVFGGYLSYFLEYSYSFVCSFYLALKVYFTRGFSAVHVSNPPDFLFLIAIFFKLGGVKFVWDQHDLAPDMFLCKFGQGKSGGKENILYKTLLFLEKMSAELCDIYIATCRLGKRITNSRTDIKAPQFIVRSAPDLKKINKANADSKLVNEFTKKFKYLAVYLGVMGPQDGIDKLLRSVRYVVKELKRTDIGFVLLGEGDALNDLKRMAKDLEINDYIYFAGWANYKMISSYFNVSHIGLMPEPKNSYTNNSLHNKVLEYMAFGLPVVSYDLDEARASAGEAAMYITGNNEEEFARSIVELMDNPSQRAQMGEIGKKRLVRKEFGWDSSAKELVKAYQKNLFREFKEMGS